MFRGRISIISGSEQETVKAYPFIGFGLERFYPAALYSPSQPGSAVRNPDSSKGSGNEPCRCANPTAINGMRGFFSTSAACVKCPPPQDRSPSPDLRFRQKRLAGQPPPLRRAQTLKSPPNRAFYEFSRRAEFTSMQVRTWSS